MLLGALAEKPRNSRCGKLVTTRDEPLPFRRWILATRLVAGIPTTAFFTQSHHCLGSLDDAFGWRCAFGSGRILNAIIPGVRRLAHTFSQSEGLPSGHCGNTGSWVPARQVSIRPKDYLHNLFTRLVIP